MANILTLGTSAIRELDGLFSLNDLHRASGGEEKHEPNRFIRLEQTQALIAEIEQPPKMADAKAGNPALVKRHGGRNGSQTYACRELVIAYAAWISPAFHLKVIRVFLDTQAPALPAPASVGDDLNAAIAVAVREAVANLPVPAGAPEFNLPHITFTRPPEVGTYKRDLANPYPRDGRTIEMAKDIAEQIRSVGNRIKNTNRMGSPALAKFGEELEEAAEVLRDLIISGWTEVDEALSCLSTAQHFLNRWQGRGGRTGNVG